MFLKVGITSMKDNLLAGIDCGATKVMVQSGVYSSTTNKISPGSINQEFRYSDHPDWNSNFSPVPIDIQENENQCNNISLTDDEINQGSIIIETIASSMKILDDHKVGLCFPGLKNHDGIVVMANGPRIPNLSHHIKPVKTILNDSDCCVLGELKSTIGMMQNTKNGIYIGGGTGIADGIIINSKLLTLNSLEHIPRSWEISLGFNETVETLLSPAGMVKKYNDQNNTEIKVLAELIHKKEFNEIMDGALKAFLKLVEVRERFFQSQNEEIQEIVIGQRLGKFFNDFGEKYLKRFQSSTKIPIKISSDRRTAALGAAISFTCS
tara:strand:- start:2852 stop:3820 length:969 start_codon:yes stop_codon:yes gene_type:complete